MKKTLLDKIAWAEDKARSKNATKEDICDIERWLSYFQHERLIHLIVTVFVGLLVMISIVVLILSPSIPSFALTSLLVILFIFYIAHYYILENGVQKLYKLTDDLLASLREK